MPKTMNNVVDEIHRELAKLAHGKPVKIAVVDRVIQKIAGADPRTVEKYKKYMSNCGVIWVDGKTGDIAIRGTA